MRIEPITCLRPTPERVADFAALPYDVFTDEEARSYVAAHPTSFLAIDRPETSFDPTCDPQAPEVYEHAAQLLRERQLDGTLTRDEHPCYYIYELSAGDHQQTGLMAAVSADDYLDGTLRRHELTLTTKELDRVKHIKGLRAQTGPVFIAYHDNAAIDAIISAAKLATPCYDFTSGDGVHQRVWRIAREVAVEALGVAFSTIDRAYIADGHHRAAAAVRICEERRAEGKQNDPSDHFLAVLFPAGQLRILPYDRVVYTTAGLDEDTLLSRIESAGFACSDPVDDPVRPNEAGTIGLYAFGTWRKLTWRTERNDLDVTLLQDNVLAPVLGIEDPRTNKNIAFFGGEAPEDLARRAGESGIVFTLFPTSMEELMNTSDAGELMPPKSTWFDPKLLSGLALRRIW